MKRSVIALALALGLIGGTMSAAEAAPRQRTPDCITKPEYKKLEQLDRRFFLDPVDVVDVVGTIGHTWYDVDTGAFDDETGSYNYDWDLGYLIPKCRTWKSKYRYATAWFDDYTYSSREGTLTLVGLATHPNNFWSASQE